MEGNVEAPMIFCLSFLPLHPKEKKIQKTFFSVNQKHWGKKTILFLLNCCQWLSPWEEVSSELEHHGGSQKHGNRLQTCRQDVRKL